MSERSRTLIERFEVRKSRRQKEEFRRWLCAELEGLGYAPRVEKNGFSHNVVVGDVETANVLYTAHYDTCAVMPVPNFITPHHALWYGLYQLALVAAMLLLGVTAEVAVLLLWRDCPLAVAIGVLPAVMLFCCWWLLAGPANRHTINDNTSGVLTLLEIATALPQEQRDGVALVFFDHEELGLFGSDAFASRHKAVKKNTLVLNFDCVSDGDHIHFFPSRRLKKDEPLLRMIERAFVPCAGKRVEVVRGFGFYPSDQVKFRRGVGVCALKKKPVIGYYLDRIHTKRDTVLMEENIMLLRDGAIALAQCMAEQRA